MSTFTNTAREVEMPNGDVVVIHNAPTGGENTTSNIKKFKYDDNGHVTESTAADAEDLNLSGYSTPTTGSTDIGTSDDVQTAIGKLDHQSHIDQTNILLVQDATEELVDKGAKNIIDIQTPDESLLTSYTSTANGGVALTINNAAWTSYRVKFSTIINTAYVCKIFVDSAPTTDVYVFIQNSSGQNYTGGAIKSDTTELIREFTATETARGRLTINLNNGGTPLTNAITVRVMICTKAEWDMSHEYEPYALPNYDLTRLEAEDRASLAEVVDSGAKNKLDFASLEYANGHGAPAVTKTDTAITISSGNAWARVVYSGIHLKAGTYVLSVNITSATFTTGSVGTIRIVDNEWATGGVAYLEFNSIGKVSCIFVVDTESDLYFSFSPNYSGSDISTANSFTATDIMICTLDEWKVSQNFAPYALPNYDLTVREAEDRAALAEQVDEGAKNILPDLRNLGGSVFNATMSMDEKSVSVAASGDYGYGTLVYRNLKVGNYVCSCNIKSRTGSSITKIAVRSNSVMGVDLGANEFTTNGKIYFSFNVTEQTDLYIMFYGAFGGFINETSYIADDVMICTEADWKISQNYAPYRKSLDQLEATKVPALSGSITSGDLNDVIINTFAMYANTVSSLPTSDNYYVETSVFDANSLLQRAYNIATAESYVRVKCVGTWSAWKHITNA